MTRVHDMGGRFGDGAVRPEPEDAPRIAHPWQERALAITLAAGALGAWSIDAARYARESLPAADYNRFSYYEKWIAALADLLLARGLVTADELARAGTWATGEMPRPATPGATEGGANDAQTSRPQAPRLDPRALPAAGVAAALRRGSPSLRPDGPAPAYAPGARVRCRLPSRNLIVRGGHTRLPAYAAGHVGEIIACHGNHVLPDMNAHFLGEAPEPLYGVAFAAADLWGEAEVAGDRVMIDLWQSYLEPAA